MRVYCRCVCLFCVTQKPAYDLPIRDWSSDVCSSDLKIVKRVGWSPVGDRRPERGCENDDPARRIVTELHCPVDSEEDARHQCHGRPPLAQAPLDQRQGRCGAGGLVRQLPQGFPIASDRAKRSPGTDDGVAFRLDTPPVPGLQERRSEEHPSALPLIMPIWYA